MNGQINKSHSEYTTAKLTTASAAALLRVAHAIQKRRRELPSSTSGSLYLRPMNETHRIKKVTHVIPKKGGGIGSHHSVTDHHRLVGLYTRPTNETHWTAYTMAKRPRLIKYQVGSAIPSSDARSHLLATIHGSRWLVRARCGIVPTCSHGKYEYEWWYTIILLRRMQQSKLTCKGRGNTYISRQMLRRVPNQ